MEDKRMDSTDIVLDVDGQKVPLNPFVRRIFTQTITGMLRALDGIKADPKEIHITIKKEGKA
jgi:hypothetical protein